MVKTITVKVNVSRSNTKGGNKMKKQLNVIDRLKAHKCMKKIESIADT